MESEKEAEREKRALLRLQFLNVLKYMENHKVEIQTYRGASVSGVFRSTDYNLTNIHINNLNTPIGVVPEALIRASDIVYIHLNLKEKNNENWDNQRPLNEISQTDSNSMFLFNKLLT